ncbi:hypothetical protein [Nostoc sp.]
MRYGKLKKKKSNRKRPNWKKSVAMAQAPEAIASYSRIQVFEPHLS